MRPQDRLLLGLLTGLVLVVTLGPLVMTAVQIIHDPPPQHSELALFGAVGEALERLLWGLGVAAVVLILRVVVAATRAHRTHERQRIMFWQSRKRRPTDELARGITFTRDGQPT